ncbi:MAG: AtpZ/AtpI family protein [Syntrophomonadaceae bacterium]|nr:AtpZ/AtpI family protein [Syntrophomonadaceae bacterium]
MADKKQNWPRALADAMNLATSVAAAIALGYFGGKWLDGKFDTGPWLSIGGLLFGMLTAGKMMWERLTAENRKKPSPGSGAGEEQN